MLTKKRLTLALKFAVSGLLIWFVLSRVDLDAAATQIAAMDLAMVVLALVIVLVQIVPATLRWTAVLDAIEAPLAFVEAVKFFFIGVFFNQALLSSVGGDAVRIYVAHRAALTLRGAINGVMLERVATVIALVLLVAAMQPFFQSGIDDEAARWLMPFLALLAAALAGGLAFLMVLDRLPARLHRWRLVRGLTYLADDARKVFLAPKPLAKAIAWGVVGHTNVSLAAYVLAVGLHIEVTVLDCVTLIPLVILVTTLPISIAGWGVREVAMVGAFDLVGVAQGSATVLSLLLGVLFVVGSLPGGVLWLRSGATRKGLAAAAGEAVRGASKAS